MRTSTLPLLGLRCHGPVLRMLALRMVGVVLVATVAAACSVDSADSVTVTAEEAPAPAETEADDPAVGPEPTATPVEPEPGDDGTIAAPTSVADTSEPTEDDDPCALIDAGYIEVLAQSQVAEMLPDELTEVPRCLYLMESGARVLAGASESRIWARILPEVLAMIDEAGIFSDDENAAKIDAARERLEDVDSLDNDEACALFVEFVELQGAGAGATEVVNFVPDATRPLAVNGQRCVDGVYATVQMEDVGIVDDAATYQSVIGVLDAVHAAGVEAAS